MYDDQDEPLTVYSPLYMLKVEQICFACSAPVEVIAIASTNLIDPEAGDPDELIDEACLLSNVASWPPELLAEIQAIHPNFQLQYSQTMDLDYYMTRCTCGAHQGDHFVQKALFNAAAHEPELITATKLATEGQWTMACGYSTSSAYEPLIANL